MAKFLTDNELNHELGKLFESADEQIILISPYIKLHDRYVSILRTKIDKPKVKIIIVFGKNEEDFSRSMKQEDFNFFKEFPNIEIRYEKRLHAKYYCNESYAILTSMNLYNFSQDNNIEFGVMTKTSLLEDFTNNLLHNFNREDFDSTAANYFSRVIDQSDLLFRKTPEYESANFGLSKKYKSSKTEVDKLTDFFSDRPKYEANARKNNFEHKPFNNQLTNNEIPVEYKTETDIANPITTNMKYLSATAISKELGISNKELNNEFAKLQLIEKKNDEWVLTSLGKSKGAQMKKSQYGEYIAWPETIKIEISRMPN